MKKTHRIQNRQQSKIIGTKTERTRRCTREQKEEKETVLV